MEQNHVVYFSDGSFVVRNVHLNPNLFKIPEAKVEGYFDAKGRLLEFSPKKLKYASLKKLRQLGRFEVYHRKDKV